MRSLLLLVIGGVGAGACGGKAPPPAKAEPEVVARKSTRVPVEEEPEEGVQIINARGHMDPKVIEAGIAPHAQELSDCYTTNLKKRRWLGGHVVIHWEINKDGVVTTVRLAESDLGAWPIEKCLLEVARAAVFDQPPIGGDADFQIPLDFTAKGRLISWDDDQAMRAVGGQLVKLDACATKKVRSPSDVTVTLYVGPGGKAQSVGFAGKTVIDDAWGDCAAKAALALRLPDPRGQIAKLAVRYRAE